ncbi:hypothetical protein M378DRAFT_786012 [Amanita muscaria Koide BX008]|uniref:Glutaredoxin domain-containing protein n=1 Tax=Amanita muscaria (strain Koide BX008) TaxID=946122 RepID=A0A0C2XJ01_AMAMK|nr:hypothetical protein M378DRAFT_786012 [Amanita muscaria Koide BX008]
MLPRLLRRRRALFILPAVIFALVLLSVQRSGSLTNHRVSREKLTGYFGPNVDEIYGLIHLVLSGDIEHHDLINNAVGLSMYADGKVVDWKDEVQRLNNDYPIVIFGERYCPYNRRVKKILSAYEITPAPYNVELDMRRDSSIIRPVLTRLTDRATLPNILLRGKSIGGSDELLALHRSQKLEHILREAGAVVRATGEESTPMNDNVAMMIAGLDEMWQN